MGVYLGGINSTAGNLVKLHKGKGVTPKKDKKVCGRGVHLFRQPKVIGNIIEFIVS